MNNIAHKVENFGNLLAQLFHFASLFVIGAIVLWSAIHEVFGMFDKGHAALHDILMLFIYLELGAMIGIYFRTKRLPVLFLIYIAITALTRVIAVEVKSMDGVKVLEITGAILILAMAGFVLSLPAKSMFGGKFNIQAGPGSDNQ